MVNFDEEIERRGTHSNKWDSMGAALGITAPDALPMWVADMDFRPPEAVQQALARMLDHGVYGYFGDDADYLASICWWMDTRHGWRVDPKAIFTTHGLVNGTALCVETFTDPGDHVVLFTPVYHAFARVVKAAGRVVTELPLALDDGRYTFDFDAYEARLSGRERMLILCSPQNPGGRVWTRAELEQVADFARRHDLMIVSDEIHCDLVYPGQTHVPMASLPGIEDRLAMMTATTKTFNIAGAHIGNVILTDPDLRARFARKMTAFGISPNSFGMHMVTAAYSPEGAAWVDALMEYLDGNRRLFDAGIAALPGVTSMPLEGTYLSWVDFSGTGMEPAEFTARVEGDARIGVNRGPSFGLGGETYLRFNLATPRARVQEAVARLGRAFADLQ